MNLLHKNCHSIALLPYLFLLIVIAYIKNNKFKLINDKVFCKVDDLNVEITVLMPF